ncbi:MAG: CARDB domain-containing protein [Thermofilaceae archaeon]
MNLRSNTVKIVVSLLLALQFSLLFANWGTECYAQEEYYREKIQTLLNNVRASEYQFTSKFYGKEERIRFGFQVLGEEVLEGESAWKVYFYVTAEETNTAYLWVSKSSGRIIKALVDENEFTGEMAQAFGVLFLQYWITWVGHYEEQWSVEGIGEIAETPFGRLVFLGSERKDFGPTRLLIYKWIWEGYVTAPEEYRYRQEVWLAPVSFGVLLAKLYFENLDKSEYGGMELLSIELANPQALPRILIKAVADKTQVRPGEEVTFSIRCSNNGSAPGFYNLTAAVDGEVMKNWFLVLKPGESRSFVYRVSFTEEGDYWVNIGDESFLISVRSVQPAKFEVSGLNVNPSAPKVGDRVTVTITVKNTGGVSGSYDVTLKVGGNVVETKTVTLNPDESATVTFYYTPGSEGTYSVEVDGLSTSITVSGKEEAVVGAGIPMWALAAVAVLVVAVILVFLIIRRRKQSAVPPPPPPPPSA